MIQEFIKLKWTLLHYKEIYELIKREEQEWIKIWTIQVMTWWETETKDKQASYIFKHIYGMEYVKNIMIHPGEKESNWKLERLRNKQINNRFSLIILEYDKSILGCLLKHIRQLSVQKNCL